MKELTKAYQCDYCHKVFATKSGIVKHEKCCSKNPKNISMCKDCKHLKVETKTWDEDVYIGYGEYSTRTCKSTSFICEKFSNKQMYHPKALRMREDIKDAILTQTECKMPTIDEGCEGFEYDTDIDF